MEFRKPHEAIITTQEGMMLIVARSPEPERFARQKLRGRVTGIMAVPFGACPEKYFDKEICIFADADGFLWICVMEEANRGEPQ